MRPLFICSLLTLGLSLLAGSLPVRAQQFDLSFNKRSDRIEIPFEYHNNFIVVRIVFDNLLPLKFILDTGAEHTVLTKREITDLLQFQYERRFPIVGSDLERELFALLVRGVDLSLPGMVAYNRSLLVLEDDYFRFEEFAGVNVQGILGADIFRRFVVEINYRKQRLVLYDPAKFRPPGDHVQYPVEIYRNKPYIITRVQFPNGRTIPTKLLVDSGANLALLLYTDTDPDLAVPEKVIKSRIGIGLGGYLEGFLGRVRKLEIGDFDMDGVITNFQQLSPDLDTSYLNGRHGILGNQVLSRFNLIIDYPREEMYLHPARKYGKKFPFDKSGIVLAASGVDLKTYTIYDLIEGSPAAEAGVQIGDEIIRINWFPARFFSLEDITGKFMARTGKKIKLVLLREGEKIKITFRLRDLI
ncbi:MAG: aspartyl protease family protein [Saprospiraceae bacterium]|nr:aspartyl protease family protein [Saprospiraceae bacterium]